MTVHDMFIGFNLSSQSFITKVMPSFHLGDQAVLVLLARAMIQKAKGEEFFYTKFKTRLSIQLRHPIFEAPRSSKNGSQAGCSHKQKAREAEDGRWPGGRGVGVSSMNFSFPFFFWLHGRRDLSSPTSDITCSSCIGSTVVPTTRDPFSFFLFFPS